jgi:hypothetical protein
MAVDTGETLYVVMAGLAPAGDLGGAMLVDSGVRHKSNAAGVGPAGQAGELKVRYFFAGAAGLSADGSVTGGASKRSILAALRSLSTS